MWEQRQCLARLPKAQWTNQRRGIGYGTLIIERWSRASVYDGKWKGCSTVCAIGFGASNGFIQLAVTARRGRLTQHEWKPRDCWAKSLAVLIHLANEEKTRDEDRTAKTFDKEAERYLARRKEAMKPRVFRELQRHFNNHAKPLHSLSLDEIRRATIAEVLNDIQDERGPTVRNRFRSNLSAFFAWAVAQGFLETNPVEGTAKAAENGPRERVLTPAELAEVWTALGTDDFSNIVRLLILTAQRREEIGGLRWDEVDFERGLIVLPPERTKNKRQHELPLSSQAQVILERRKASGVVTQFANTSPVFGEGQRGFSGWGYSKARLDERLAKQRKEGGAKEMPKFTLHDLRRTAARMMADKLGVLPHIIEAILNHVSGHKSGVAGVYHPRQIHRGDARSPREVGRLRRGNHIAKAEGDPA